MPRVNYEPHSIESLRVLQNRIQLLEMVLAGCIQQLETAGVTEIETLHNLSMERGITHMTTFLTTLQSTVISETTRQRMDAVRESGMPTPKRVIKAKIVPAKGRAKKSTECN